MRKTITNIIKGYNKSNPEILFFTYFSATHSHSNAQYLERNALRHEGHFGLTIKNTHDKSKYLQIENVEHAKQLIVALETAIDFGWLFTEDEIRRYAVKCTTTLKDLIEAKNS